jgi:hypothetical protein
VRATRDDATATRSARDYSDQVDAFVRLEDAPHLLFAQVGRRGHDDVEWRRFDTEAALATADPDASAYVWTRDAHIIFAGFRLQSGSRDWVHVIGYYFRDDGAVARISAQLNTFYGDLSVEREWYFGSDGAVVCETTEYRDLETQQPKVPDEDFIDREVPIYLTTQELPFADLLDL